MVFICSFFKERGDDGANLLQVPEVMMVPFPGPIKLRAPYCCKVRDGDRAERCFLKDDCV